MEKLIQWKSVYYRSQENCSITSTGNGNTIRSRITGKAEEINYTADYCIISDRGWDTISFEVTAVLNGNSYRVSGEKKNAGWMINGLHDYRFDRCNDIDITLTPFTNTLPINRLKLAAGEHRQITVLYIDVLEQKIRPARQQYTRLSDTEYKFENVPNNFEAVITVDADGFVVDYPGLFKKSS